MKTILLVFLALLASSSILAAPDAFPDEWHQCTYDNECIKVQNACGAPTSINRNSIDKYRKFEGPLFACAEPADPKQNTFHSAYVKCVRKRCEAVQPK